MSHLLFATITSKGAFGSPSISCRLLEFLGVAAITEQLIGILRWPALLVVLMLSTFAAIAWLVVSLLLEGGPYCDRALQQGRHQRPIPDCHITPLSLQNVSVVARVKLVEGTMHKAAIAVGLLTPGNYYVAAAYALEGRLDLFRFEDGKSQRIRSRRRSSIGMLELRADTGDASISRS